MKVKQKGTIFLNQHKLTYNQLIKDNLTIKNGRCCINSLYVAEILQIEHICLVNQIKTVLTFFPIFIGSLFIEEFEEEESFYLNIDSLSFLNLGVQYNFDNIFPLFNLVTYMREEEEKMVLKIIN